MKQLRLIKHKVHVPESRTLFLLILEAVAAQHYGAVWAQGDAEVLLCLPRSISALEELPESFSHATATREGHQAILTVPGREGAERSQKGQSGWKCGRSRETAEHEEKIKEKQYSKFKGNN